MAESDLTLDQYKLEAEAGDSAGFGMGARFDDTAWTPEQQRQITKALHSGLRMVYFTPELPGVPAAYDWTFLQPRSTIVLPEGATVIPLPADFGGLNGRIIPVSDGATQWPIAVVGRHELYGARAVGSSNTGRPTMAYIEAVRNLASNRANRYELQIFPTADAEYTLQVWYYLLPNAPSDMLPHVYGGAPHAETFKAAVRAAYERYCLNIVGGPEWATYIERLQASVAYDRRFKPVTIGPNIDRSDECEFGLRGPHDREYVPLYVNGVLAGYP